MWLFYCLWASEFDKLLEGNFLCQFTIKMNNHYDSAICFLGISIEMIGR